MNGQPDKGQQPKNADQQRLRAPDDPAERHAGGFRDVVEHEGFLNEEGVYTDAAWTNDHGYTAKYQHGERGGEAEFAGGGEAEEADVQHGQVLEPDADGVEDEPAELFAVHFTDGREAVPHAPQQRSHLDSGFGGGEFLQQEDKEADDCGRNGENDEPLLRVRIGELGPHGRPYFGREVPGNQVQLQKEAKQEHQHQAHQVQRPFRDHGADELVRRYLLVVGEHAATGDLPEARHAHINEVADHDGKKGIQCTGMVILCGNEDLPAEGAGKVAADADNKGGNDQPVVAAEECAFDILELLRRHVLDCQPDHEQANTKKSKEFQDVFQRLGHERWRLVYSLLPSFGKTAMGVCCFASSKSIVA